MAIPLEQICCDPSASPYPPTTPTHPPLSLPNGIACGRQVKYAKDSEGKILKDEEGKNVVEQAGRGVTNQGIRRSAAQWAGRCGCQLILDLANNGRWKTLDTIAVYMGQGAKKRKEAEFAHGTDPIFRTWVWKPVTVAGISTRNEL